MKYWVLTTGEASAYCEVRIYSHYLKGSWESFFTAKVKYYRTHGGSISLINVQEISKKTYEALMGKGKK